MIHNICYANALQYFGFPADPRKPAAAVGSTTTFKRAGKGTKA
jgi:hypothetical protein